MINGAKVVIDKVFLVLENQLTAQKRADRLKQNKNKNYLSQCQRNYTSCGPEVQHCHALLLIQVNVLLLECRTCLSLDLEDEKLARPTNESRVDAGRFRLQLLLAVVVVFDDCGGGLEKVPEPERNCSSHGCWRACCAVGRFFSSYSNNWDTKSLANSDIGSQTSSSNSNRPTRTFWEPKGLLWERCKG